MSFNIAIDGPAGAGKSTIAKKIAKELGFVYVDTGAMYRAMALYFLRSNISNEDEQAISRASENVEITIQYENGEQQVFLNGENVSGEIRKEEVGNMASKTSGYGQVRKKLGFVYVDTGAMYRAMALYFLRSNISNEDEQAISRASENVEITIQYENGEQQVFLNGENVSGEIRKEEVGNMASKTSGYGQVRKKLVELQQQLAKKADVVMDGRDIGTVVLPDAQVKVYLTASVATRAKRRYDELSEKGQECNLEKIEADIEQRDYQDMHRENSPLRQAEDATLVDSSNMSIEEVVAAIKKLYEDVCNA